jgi:hypothetical protein
MLYHIVGQRHVLSPAPRDVISYVLLEMAVSLIKIQPQVSFLESGRMFAPGNAYHECL